MVLRLEVVEKGSLAHVSGLGDVFDGDVLESALGEELEGAAEEAEPGVRGAALAASYGLGRGRAPGGGGREGRIQFTTSSHNRLLTELDRQSDC